VTFSKKFRPFSLRKNLLLSTVSALLLGLITLGSPVSAGATSRLALTLRAPAAPLYLTATAVDAQGNVFTTALTSNQVFVLPSTTGTLFGQHVVRGQMVQLTALKGLDFPAAIAVDGHGDLFVTNTGYADSVTVLARTNRTIFGQAFVANRSTTLNAAHGIISPGGLAFGSNGELYVVSNALGDIAVVPPVSGNYFGDAAPANQTTFLSATSGLDGPSGLAVDSAGDLFITANTGLYALAPTSVSLYGQSFTADVMAALSQFASNVNVTAGVAVDSASNLFVAYANLGQGVSVLPGPTTTSLFGTVVVPGTRSDLATPANGITREIIGVSTSPAGDLFVTVLSSTINMTHIQSHLAILPHATGFFEGVRVAQGQLHAFSNRTLVGPYGGFIQGNGNGDVVADSQGNVFFTSPLSGKVMVLPKVSEELFGQSLHAGVVAALRALSTLRNPSAIAIDKRDDLFVGQISAGQANSGAITVLTRKPQTVFGQPVRPNTATNLRMVSTTGDVGAMTFDARGDLLYTTLGGTSGVFIIANVTHQFFGQRLLERRDVAVSALSSVTNPIGNLKFDANGNLYFLTAPSGPNVVTVLAPAVTTLFGQSIPANTLTTLNVSANLFPSTFSASSISLDQNGDLFIAGRGVQQGGTTGSTFVVPKRSGVLLDQQVVANHPRLINGGLQVASFWASCWRQGVLWVLSPVGLYSI